MVTADDDALRAARRRGAAGAAMGAKAVADATQARPAACSAATRQRPLARHRDASREAPACRRAPLGGPAAALQRGCL